MSTDKNGSNSRERRHFSPQQKVAVVKEHLVDRVPISDLCDRHHIQPAQFSLWQKQLFENGAAAFERKTKNAGPTPVERQVEGLRAKLATLASTFRLRHSGVANGCSNTASMFTAVTQESSETGTTTACLTAARACIKSAAHIGTNSFLALCEQSSIISAPTARGMQKAINMTSRTAIRTRRH